MNRHIHPEASRVSEPSESLVGELPDKDVPAEASPTDASRPKYPGADVSQEALEGAARSFATLRDARAFTLLCRGTWRALQDAVLRVGVDDCDVDAVVNRALFVVWTRRDALRGGAYQQFVQYARKVARHRAIEWQREEAARRQTVFLADDPREHCVGEDDCDATVPTPEELVAACEALSVLSPREQVVVNARAEGMTWKEVSAEARVSVARVRRIYAAALRRLHPEDA